jgi:hypothetical protein
MVSGRAAKRGGRDQATSGVHRVAQHEVMMGEEEPQL